jgi:hypothetical protein
MPTYVPPTGYNARPEVAVSGHPAYFYGSLPQDTQDMLAQITSVACASNVATIVMTIQQGNIPVVGNLISVQGVQTASGAYNVSEVPIATISGNAATGVYTVTFACTTADLTTTAASGKAIVTIQEVAEAVAANTSCAIYVPSQEPVDNGVRSITVATTFPVLQASTGAATVTLYTAINNPGVAPAAGNEWTSMGTVAVAAAGAQTQGPLQTYTVPAGRFFCVQTSGVTGTNKIICKMIS